MAAIQAVPTVGAHIGGPRPVDETERVLCNPADTREPVAVSASVGPDVVAQALDVAATAAPSWAKTSPLERGAILGRAAELMAARAERLAVQMTREMGKIIGEARLEVQRSVDVLRFFAQASRVEQGRPTL